MAAIFTLLVVIVLSLLVVRVATVALTLTGVSQQLARFQARSAFTGTGFTTSETERVVQHPVRRRIILLLMLLGNAGFITAISTLILSFMNLDTQGGSFWLRASALVAGLVLLWIIAHSPWVDRRMSLVISWALRRWTTLEVRDYAGVLHLGNDYAVAELQVQPGDWIADRTLAELRLNDEGVLVLGIEKRDGRYMGAPRGESRAAPHDTLIIYGPTATLADLDRRRAGRVGTIKHMQSVERQQQIETEQEEEIANGRLSAGEGVAEDNVPR